MSLVTEALLIGSYAAKVRRVLPTWRNGHVGDADFICTRPAAQRILGLFGAPLVEHAPDRCYRIDRTGGLNIDIDLRGHLLPLVGAYADTMTISINGLELTCLVARPELVAGLRAASQGMVPSAAEKARNDVEGYAALGICIPDEIAAAALAFRMPPRRR